MKSVRALTVGLLLSSVVLVVAFVVPGEGKIALAASAKLGVLQIKVEGLPSSAKPSFQVSGPSLKTTVVGPVKLKNLSVGRYTVRGRAFYSKDTKYVPSPVAAVRVNGKTVVVARVRFTPVKIKSSLTIKVSVAPGGKRPSVLVRGPKGFSKRITSTTKFDAIFPGKYSVTSVEVNSGRLVYVPGVSDPNPQVYPGEATAVRIGWKSARDKNLVVVQEGVLLTTPVLVNGQGTLEVSDVTGIDIGDPLLLPATDTTPQSVVKVVSIVGKQLVVKGSSIYEALPIVNYEYQGTEEPVGDVAKSGVAASSADPFDGQKLKFSCETTAGFGAESYGWEHIVGKITPILKVKSAVMDWDLTSRQLFTGPKKIEFIITAGIKREAVIDLSLTLKRSCKGSVKVAYPLPPIAGIPLYLRGELGIEASLNAKYMFGSKVDSHQTFSVDMGVRYSDRELSPVFTPNLDLGFEGSPVSDWDSEGSFYAEAGIFAGIYLSPFDGPKEVGGWALGAEVDLKAGITTSVGIGADFSIAPRLAATPTSLTVTGSPYIYSKTAAELVASAVGTVLGVSKEFDLGEKVDLFNGKRYFPEKKRSVLFSLIQSDKGNSTSTTTTVTPKTTTTSTTTIAATTTTVSPGVQPVAAPDASSGSSDTNIIFDLLSNDSFSASHPAVKSSLKLCSIAPREMPNSCTRTSLVVVDEGTYTVNADGTVTFDPLPIFAGVASPVTYIVADTLGRYVSATITPTILECSTAGAYCVGDVGPGGGLVIYVASSNFSSPGSACGSACKYLEAATTGWITSATPAGQTNCIIPGASVDPKCEWSGNTSDAIGSTGTAIGAGYANTSAMIAQSSTAGNAGTVARAFRGGGKNDWFLPSKDELNELYRQRQTVGFVSDVYWSSSEYIGAGNAWYQSFANAVQIGSAKSTTMYVRPVRAF